MIEQVKCQCINTRANLKDVIDVMNHHKLGAVCIVDNKNNLKGIITDGDIKKKIN